MTERERIEALVAPIETRANDPHPSSVHNASTRHDVLFMLVELRAMAERADKLEAGLSEAIDRWEEAAQYKGDYLRDKHGDTEDAAELRRLLSSKTDG